MTGSLVLAIALVGCGEAQIQPYEVIVEELPITETPKEQAMMAYQEILRGAPAIEGEHEELADASFDYEQNIKMFGNHYDLFALYDINQDEIPELIAMSTVNFRWTPVSVYTFKDGEAILIKDKQNMEAHGTFELCSTANGAYSTYICENNHIHNVWCGTNPLDEEVKEDYAYVLDGTSFTAVDCSSGENENAVYFYDIAKTNSEDNRKDN